MIFEQSRSLESILLRSARVLILAGLSAGVLGAQGVIETTKLTDFRATRGRVEDARRSLDGQWVVYRASQETSDVVELFAVPAMGGVVTKLNQPLTRGGDVLDFAISPDSLWVAFLADAEIEEKNELYRVPIDGGTVIRVNAAMVPAGDVSEFRFSPDSQHVVYRANQRHYLIEELFSHDLDTSTVAMLTSTLELDDFLREFDFSPDSSRVVFIISNSNNGDREMLSVPIDGGAATLLGDPPSRPDDVRHFRITSDSQRVIFYRGAGAESLLLGGPITGGPTTRLSPVGMEVKSDFLLTSDDDTAVLRASLEGASFELFAVDLASGTATNLSGSSSRIDQFFLSPDEAQVAFFGISLFGNPSTYDGLAIVPIAGGLATGLTNELRTVEGLLFTPDGSQIVYRTAGGTDRLFSAATDGSGSEVDLVPEVGQMGVWQFSLEAAGTHVVYLSDRDGNDRVFEIYRRPVTGGAATRINDPLLADANVEGAFFGGAEVYYWADQDELGVVELYRASSTGGSPTRLSAPMLGTGGGSRCVRWTPDEKQVLFFADQNVSDRFEAWRYSLAEGGPATRLTEEPFAVSTCRREFLDPSATKWIVEVSAGNDDVFGLWALPVAGGPAVRLDDPVADSVQRSMLTSDGRFVVYSTENGSVRLFRAAVGGGDIRFLADLGHSSNWAVSPDGQFVVYRAASDRLMSVPIEAGTAVQISPAGFDVRTRDEIRITSDSRRVVFRAFSQDTLRQQALSVPIEGGTAVSLTAGLASCNTALRDEVAITLTPDGTRALVDCGVLNDSQLLAVPVGGGSPVELIDSGDFGGFFSRLGVSRDSTHVVARLGGAFGTFALLGVPTLGGEVKTFISISSFSTTREVGDFAITPDSSAVVFLSDTLEGPRWDLFSAPLGPGDTRQLNPEGNVDAFVISPDSSRVFYEAAPLFFDRASKTDLVSVPLAGGPVQTYHPVNPIGQFIGLTQAGSNGESVLYGGSIEAAGTGDLFFSRNVLLFADGFESGDTLRWSGAVP